MSRPRSSSTADQTVLPAPDLTREPDEDLQVQDAASLGVIGCHHCGTVWEGAQPHQRCGVCHAPLHVRKADSLTRTWALLIAACIMYIPANMMPVMVTSTLFDEQRDTILSGVIYFWTAGEWGLALVVFVASFLVPLFKLVALGILVFSARRHSRWRRLQRARLYRVVESIGRWSMLDVFVVSVLTGLVKIHGFANIHAGIGIAAFGAVVVLTMLASLSFDPRLIWDERPQDQDLLDPGHAIPDIPSPQDTAHKPQETA